MEYLDLIVIAVVGIAAGWLAMRQWQGASLEARIAMIERAVAAVEQLYPGETGQFKHDWVWGRVRKWLPDEDADLLEAMIEGAVYRLKRAPVTGAPAERPHPRANGRVG